VIGIVVLGLALGVALTRLIAWQLREPESPAPRSTARDWLPLAGSVIRRDWLSLAVELITLAMTVVLWRSYGPTAQFALLLLASLVLIDTAAIDWRVKLIDTLVLVAATIGAVAFAPWITGSWLVSLLGLLAAGFVFVLFFVIAKMLYPGQAAPFGLGDVYLGMFIGALVGLFEVGPALLYGMLMAGLASIALIVVRGYGRARHIPISYGTFLCLGVLLYLAIWPM
jgi:leader peptidase (prepilin peptidase) / N-methyltransferase